MEDYKKLAEILVKHSCKIKCGDRVLIEQSNTDIDFLIILIKEIKKAGGLVFINNIIPEISRELLFDVSEEYINQKTEFVLPDMKQIDAYISIHGTNNIFENSDVPTKNIGLNQKLFVQPVHYEERVKNTKWVILRWPTPAFAQSAKMSSQAFSEFFFRACNVDYAKMEKALTPLKNLMEKTNNVRITGPGTNLCFSIKNMPAVKCAGKNNIPDGEIFTAPIKNSVNGCVQFNIPTVYNGTRFDNVFLEFNNGKIIKATSTGNTEKLNEILNTDCGARYLGEFALGVNPFVDKSILDILFDEKMKGSVHLTPGSCYAEANNGNNSAIHWDMVLCQLKEFGGGEIFFDDVLVRKNGEFVLEELFEINPQNFL